MSRAMETEIPGVQLVSLTNEHRHWRVRQKRAGIQRDMIPLVLRSRFGATPPAPPLLITLTRIAPRRLDSDNVVGACKTARDAVADYLGLDDGDPRLTWQYADVRGPRFVHALRVRIEPRLSADCSTADAEAARYRAALVQIAGGCHAAGCPHSCPAADCSCGSPAAKIAAAALREVDHG